MSEPVRLPRLRLGVNIDHVATIRNARGGEHPDPVRAAEIVARYGADGITAHLREDRRHIRDGDLERIMAATDLPLNLEMAATEEMLAIALRHKPHAACIVPERREERTTEGGLDAAGQHNVLAPIVAALSDAGIRVSLFIEADARQIDAAIRLRAPVVELHTARWARPDLRQCRPRRRNPPARRTQHRPLSDRRSDFRRVGSECVADARVDGRGAVIIGLGSDLCNIERIQASLDRFGTRFEQRVFTATRSPKQARWPSASLPRRRSVKR